MSDAQIKFNATERERELIEKWQHLLQFKSQRETVSFTVRLGLMAMEMSGGKPITADDFASTLYTLGSRFFAAEYGDNARKTIQEFKRWREQQEITPQTSSHEKRLVQG